MNINKERNHLRAQFEETISTLHQRFTRGRDLVQSMSLKPESREAQRVVHHLQGAEASLKNANSALQKDNLILVHNELRFVDIELREVEHLVQVISRKNK